MRSRRLVYRYFNKDYRMTKNKIWAFYKLLGVASTHTQSRLAKKSLIYHLVSHSTPTWSTKSYFFPLGLSFAPFLTIRATSAFMPSFLSSAFVYGDLPSMASMLASTRTIATACASSLRCFVRACTACSPAFLFESHTCFSFTTALA